MSAKAHPPQLVEIFTFAPKSTDGRMFREGTYCLSVWEDTLPCIKWICCDGAELIEDRVHWVVLGDRRWIVTKVPQASVRSEPKPMWKLTLTHEAWEQVKHDAKAIDVSRFKVGAKFLINDDELGLRIIVRDNRETNDLYATVDPVTGNVTTNWYKSLAELRQYYGNIKFCD